MQYFQCNTLDNKKQMLTTCRTDLQVSVAEVAAEARPVLAVTAAEAVVAGTVMDKQVETGVAAGTAAAVVAVVALYP